MECVEKEFAEAERSYWLFGRCTSSWTCARSSGYTGSRVQPEPIQVLATLGFLSTGSFQQEPDRSGTEPVGRADPCQLCGTDYPKVTNVRYAAVEEERRFS